MLKIFSGYVTNVMHITRTNIKNHISHQKLLITDIQQTESYV